MPTPHHIDLACHYLDLGARQLDHLRANVDHLDDGAIHHLLVIARNNLNVAIAILDPVPGTGNRDHRRPADDRRADNLDDCGTGPG